MKVQLIIPDNVFACFIEALYEYVAAHPTSEFAMYIAPDSDGNQAMSEAEALAILERFATPRTMLRSYTKQ